MKTLQPRPRFQSATRHYHRHRADNRGWDDWIDPTGKPGTFRRKLWISATAVGLTTVTVVALFGLDVL
jgi:hypothetical protein